MIKIITAYTREANDPLKAATEILEQLNLKDNALANSVALIFSHITFIESGVARTVCGCLPLQTLGCSSQFLAVREAADEMMLTVTVLTSNDTEFATGISKPITGKNADTPIHELYQKTAASLGAQPSLIFAFMPVMFSLAHDAMITSLNHACGGIPVFGAVALDIKIKTRNPKTIYLDKDYSNRMALLLFKTPSKPRFYSAFFPEKSVFAQNAFITKAENNRIITINNEPAVSFIKKLGILQSNENGLTSAIPLVIENHDGDEPQVVVMLDINQNEELICSVSVKTGGELNIGVITADYVLESARILIQGIKNNPSGAGLIMFSCFLRNVVLGGKSMAEIDIVQKEMSDFPHPYLFLYSAGELCPRYLKSGKTMNRIYQYALIACQF